MTESSSEPKDASPSVIAQHDAMLNALPFSDTRDFDDAARGFSVDQMRGVFTLSKVVAD